MTEFAVSGHTYRTKHVNARQQLFMLHSIGPLFGPMMQYYASGQDTDVDEAARRGLLFGAFFRAFGQMQKNELNDFVDQMLGAVQRRTGGNGQGEVWIDAFNSAARREQFEDYDLMELVHISWHVLQDNLGGFFTTGFAMLNANGEPLNPSSESSGPALPTAPTI